MSLRISYLALLKLKIKNALLIINLTRSFGVLGDKFPLLLPTSIYYILIIGCIYER